MPLNYQNKNLLRTESVTDETVIRVVESTIILILIAFLIGKKIKNVPLLSEGICRFTKYFSGIFSKNNQFLLSYFALKDVFYPSFIIKTHFAAIRPLA